jgi:hypothetical protein
VADDDIERSRGSVPVPDPTLLTTQQLYRELGSLNEKTQSDIRSLRDVIETRLNEADKATTLIGDRIAGIVGSDEIDRRVLHLKEFMEEKFSSVDRQFDERDVRTEQAAIATKIAVDAALQAQKEAAGAQNESNAAAITKSEAATVKQIDGIMALLNSNVTATNDKIADLKGRLDRGEGTGNSLYSMAAAMASLLALVIAGFAALGAWHSQPSAVQPTVQYVPAPTAIPAPVTVPR